MNKLFLLLLLTCLFHSCSKDEVSTSSAIHGEWNLTYYSAGLAGYENYNKEDVTWTFNSNNTVDVLINITLPPNTYIPIQTNSTVAYAINGSQVIVGNMTYDFYYENGKLILSDHPEVDGPKIELSEISKSYLFTMLAMSRFTSGMTSF